MKNIGRWPKILSESVQLTFARAKTKKKFCLEMILLYMAKCMYEGVSEDSRHGIWHMTFI